MRTRAVFTAVACAAAILLLAGCGSSERSSAPEKSESKPAVEAVDLGHGDQSQGVKLAVKGPVQVDFKKITIPPGAGTGKHCHFGKLVAVVEHGTLTHYAPIYPGGVHVYHAGDSIVEGSGYVHEGRNEGDDDVVLLVNYITPKGEPLAESNLTHCTPK